MSAAQHAKETERDSVITRDQEEAETSVLERSAGCRGGGGRSSLTQICWTGIDRRSELAAHYRQLASQHRKASAALVDAEQRACEGMSDDDRAMSPFFHGQDVLAVSPLGRGGPGPDAPAKVVGARVVFRGVPGLDVERLQHMVDCHLARAAAMGHEFPEMGYCPLVLRGVAARVSAVDSGIAVDVSSSDDATIQEIGRRTSALRTASSQPGPEGRRP